MSEEKVTPKIFDRKREDESKTEEPMIAYRKTWTDSDGVLHDEMSKPVPVKEWAAFEKENGL